MRRPGYVLTAALMLSCASPALHAKESAPATNQAAEKEMAGAFAKLGEMFKVDPLTPEQEQRLPAARAIIDSMMPPGAMQQMMGSMFDRILQPMLAMEGKPSASSVARDLGIAQGYLDMDEEAAGKAMAIIDPQWQERRKREAEVFPKIMGEFMTLMEPTMRKVMAELYAVNFNAGELQEISAFFSTPTGGSYARKSFFMASDPRMMAGMMEAMPAMLSQMATIEKRIADAGADLPAKRKFSDMSASEKARLAELTGLEASEITSLIEQQSGEAAK